MSGLMALVAVFLVIVGFNYLKISLPNLDLKNQQSNLSFEPDKDWDNDGLNNKEESFWGTDPNKPDTDGDSYLDGEEVVSGHDPLIKAPDDLLPTDDNLTQKMSALAMAGIYEGSLKPGGPNYEESLNKLASSIADNTIGVFNVDISKIELKLVNSDKYSQQTYIEDLSPIYEELLKTFSEQMFNLEDNLNDIGLYGLAYGDISKSFGESSSHYEKIFGDLSKKSVPKNWKDSHLGLIKFVGELSQASQSVASGQNDPIKASVGLNKIVQLWDIFPKITEKYSEKIKSAGLNPSKTIFK